MDLSYRVKQRFDPIVASKRDLLAISDIRGALGVR